MAVSVSARGVIPAGLSCRRFFSALLLIVATLSLGLPVSTAAAAADDYQWEVMDSGVEATLYAVWGFAANDVYAAGEGGTVIHYDGESWQPVKPSPPIAETLRDIWGASPAHIYMVGQKGTILDYDGQGDWDTVRLKDNDVNLYGVWGSGDEVYIVGWGSSGTDKDQVVYYNGTKWLYLKPDTQLNIGDVWSWSGGFFSPGRESRVLQYAGSWENWKLGRNAPLNGIWGASPENVFAVGVQGIIFNYNGSQWQMRDSGADGDLQTVYGGSGSDVFAVGKYGAIVHYDGQSWTPLQSRTLKHLYGVWGDSATGVFAVGEDGLILHYRAPEVKAVHPAQVAVGETADVVIEGYGLVDAVSLDCGEDITVADFAVEGDARITARISVAPTAAVGRRDLTVWLPARTLTLAGGLEILAPPMAVSGLNPAAAYPGETLTVSVSGENFAAAAGLDFGEGISVDSVAVKEPNLIEAELTLDEAATPGPRDVSVSYGDDSASLTGGFTVMLPPPELAAVGPDAARPGEALAVVIDGRNFRDIKMLSFGDGIAVTGFTVDSAVMLTANINISAAALAGARDITVSNGDGEARLSDGFQVLPPVVEDDSEAENGSEAVSGSVNVGAVAGGVGGGLLLVFGGVIYWRSVRRRQREQFRENWWR